MRFGDGAIFLAHAEQAGRLNWKDPANPTYVLTDTGAAAAFVTDRGITGDGHATQVSTGYDPLNNGTLGMVAWKTFEQLEQTDILYVPGGPGVQSALQDDALLECIRRVAASSEWLVSICNGAELLGAAGLLKGREVTTNWFARERVAAYGAKVRRDRYVRDGQLVTGAGVSSSIDVGLFMAGLLKGEDVARAILAFAGENGFA